MDEVIDFLSYPKSKPVQRRLITRSQPAGGASSPWTSCGTTKEFVPLAVSAQPAAGPTGSMRINTTPGLHPASAARLATSCLSVGRGADAAVGGWWCGGISK